MERDPRWPPINGALGLLVVILVVQMWLLTATLESYLAGHESVALAGAGASGILFAACGGLYLFIRRLDRRSRETGARRPR